MIQQGVPSVPPPPVVETPSPEKTTVRLPAFDHPLYEEQSVQAQQSTFKVAIQPQPVSECVELSTAAVPIMRELERLQSIVVQKSSGAMSVDAQLKIQSEIPATVSEEPPATEAERWRLDTETLVSQKAREEAAIPPSISALTPNETPVIETPTTPSKESPELEEAIVKNFQDDVAIVPEQQDVVVGEKEVGSELMPFRGVLPPPVTVESPDKIEVVEEKVEVPAPVASPPPPSPPPPPPPPAPEKPHAQSAEEPTPPKNVEPTAAVPVIPSVQEEVIEDQILAKDIPSLSEAKSSSEALRIVVMTRLLCDRQTREERVNPVLLANQSIARPVETPKPTYVEELISDGKRHQDRILCFMGVKRVLERQFMERDTARLAKVQRLRK
ncbi:hypothetical protein AX15_007553, partial [Amanita polypyramis BW_CC]